MSNSAAAESRFLYIDGLRGVAALTVAVGHLLAAAEAQHPGILGWLAEAGEYGRYGVQIFFVLSGFVIAHSVVGGTYSSGYLGRFAARRFIRLDIPYWCVIALEVFLLWISGMVLAHYARELPSAAQIAANAFYVQVYLGFPHILPIFWTLCYEVQFYIAFVAGLVALSKPFPNNLKGSRAQFLGIAALAITFTASLALYVNLVTSPHPGLFVDRWFQFALGVITYQCYRGRWHLSAAVLANAACIAAAILLANDSYRVESLLTTAGTSTAILASRSQPLWRGALTGAALLFLGRISYSLYLLHPAIGWRATVFVRELLGASYSTTTAFFAFSVGVAASIISAWVMFWIIESPSMKLARRIDLPKAK
jgi:peptidoglycan/LPS O-acetylase OafA/YrhL